MTEGGAPVRLQKYLASAGIGSRRQCEEFIALGRVSVDGATVTELGTCVDPASQTVCFDGEPVQPEPKVYWWVNKPAGVLCTSRDTHGRTTALDLVPASGQRVYCVGRLDESSTGLMLVTNDGELALRLTHPRYRVPTTYIVTAAGKVANDAIEAMRQGVHFKEGSVRPRAIRRLGFRGQATVLSVVLCEGRNDEIRRMFARFGHKVLSVQRTAIGPVKIRKLRRGQSRPATRDEIAMLRRLVRGSDGLRDKSQTPRAAGPQNSKGRSRRSRTNVTGHSGRPGKAVPQRDSGRPGSLLG